MKVFAFPTLALFAALAWTALAAHSGGSEPLKAAGVVLVAALLCLRGLPSGRALRPLLAVATTTALVAALALDPFSALAGSHVRALGLASLLAGCLLVAHAATLMAAERQQLYRGIALLAALVAAYALLQRAGLDPLAWRGGEARRPAATLGNATVLGGWLLLALPATLLAARNAARRWPWLALAVLQLAGMLACGTRSAWLAAAAVALLIWIHVAGWRRAGPWLLLAAVLGASVLAWRPASLHDRAHLWSVAAQAWMSPQALPDLEGHEDRLRGLRLLVGYGPDQQRAALDPLLLARAPARPGAQGWEADRAHQSVLDVLLQGGLAGLAVAVWMLLALALALRRAYREGDADTRAESLALAAALGAWLLHLQFAFPLNADLALAAVLTGCALSSQGQAGLRWRWPARLTGAALLPIALALACGARVPWGDDLAPARAAEQAFVEGQEHYAAALADGRPTHLIQAAGAFERAAALASRDRDAALAAASAWVEVAAAGDRAALVRTRHWAEAVAAMTPGDARLLPLRQRMETVAARLDAQP